MTTPSWPDVPAPGTATAAQDSAMHVPPPHVSLSLPSTPASDTASETSPAAAPATTGTAAPSPHLCPCLAAAAATATPCVACATAAAATPTPPLYRGGFGCPHLRRHGSAPAGLDSSTLGSGGSSSSAPSCGCACVLALGGAAPCVAAPAQGQQDASGAAAGAAAAATGEVSSSAANSPATKSGAVARHAGILLQWLATKWNTCREAIIGVLALIIVCSAVIGCVLE